MASSARNALVTGANRGIGLATCELLAQKGYRVFLGSREAASGEAAAGSLRAQGLELAFVQLDVCDPSSVALAHESLASDKIQLDVLIHNAGVALDGFDADVVRDTMAVNVHGVIAVTDAFRDLLRADARIVMVSSGMGELSGFGSQLRQRFEDPQLTPLAIAAMLNDFEQAVRAGSYRQEGWPASAYQVSKAALNAYARWLAREPLTQAVNCVCPGWVRTDMGGRSAPRSPQEAAEGIVWAATLSSSGGFYRDGVSIPW